MAKHRTLMTLCYASRERARHGIKGKTTTVAPGSASSDLLWKTRAYQDIQAGVD
uniref:Uncharacterized protein n=1 Tax=Hyaloperonospora arabidopsidis (strain Emoy2) TaxID=559515 RepID=M4BIP7_HYAAE